MSPLSYRMDNKGSPNYPRTNSLEETTPELLELTPVDTWSLVSLVRLPPSKRDRKIYQPYLDRLSRPEIRDIGRALVEEISEESLPLSGQKVFHALRQWEKRNRRPSLGMVLDLRRRRRASPAGT